jgi:large subunit ribosomal protein L15
MDLHSLKPAKGAVKSGRRRGRGQATGKGGTAARGHKGQKSRSGYSRKRNFEGGQMPLQMRLPKRGFKSPNRTSYVALNLDQVQALADKHGVSELTMDKLRELRYVSKTDKVKVLGRGELTAAISVEANAISETARKAIEDKGGKVTLV